MKIPHNWLLPHNIDGWGRITACPEHCPGHPDWAKSQTA